MSSLSVAKLLWIIPVLLLLLMIHQLKVAYDVSKTWKEGVPVIATVTHFDIKEMVAQTHGILELSIPTSDGDSLHKKMTVPAAWLYKMGNVEEMKVHLFQDSGQNVVIDDLEKIQQQTALINAATALLFMLMTGIPILLWNRYLRKEGDPASRKIELVDE